MDARKLALLYELTSIAAKGPVSDSVGICSNVSLPLGMEVAALIAEWPELGGGGLGCPIEGDFRAYRDNERKWDISTEYGAKRYRLLAFMIHKLSKEYYASLH